VEDVIHDSAIPADRGEQHPLPPLVSGRHGVKHLLEASQGPLLVDMRREDPFELAGGVVVVVMAGLVGGEHELLDLRVWMGVDAVRGQAGEERTR
jgi:hypothetical protein